ncbi:uncharacterized protein METZ01_LOCUS125814 [marine metagenome]|uniref:Uncharacterized protein n=1 Tax=marine metagenome TaxID=408172 RepID=A0A381Y7S8_9ZZZZ
MIKGCRFKPERAAENKPIEPDMDHTSVGRKMNEL